MRGPAGEDVTGGAATAEVANQRRVNLVARPGLSAHQLRAPCGPATQHAGRFIIAPDARQHPSGQQLGDHPGGTLAIPEVLSATPTGLPRLFGRHDGVCPCQCSGCARSPVVVCRRERRTPRSPCRDRCSPLVRMSCTSIQRTAELVARRTVWSAALCRAQLPGHDGGSLAGLVSRAPTTGAADRWVLALIASVGERQAILKTTEREHALHRSGPRSNVRRLKSARERTSAKDHQPQAV